MTLRTLLTTTLVATCLTGAAFADTCAAGKTLTDGTLTFATGNPAYYPWVMDDAPEAGAGFEAAVAYAVAAEMGFDADAVAWVRTSFDEAIQPGAKSFDLNMQQFSITEDRDKIVDFSEAYYAAPMAVLVNKAAAATVPEVDALKDVVWGGMAGTTGVTMLMDVIDPAKDPLLYGDNADVVEAMKANQVDAALFDLPTALYLSAVVLDGGAVIGQFPAERSDNPDLFGMLMEEGSALKPCVDAAITALKDSGKLAEIEAEWLQEATGVPLVE